MAHTYSSDQIAQISTIRELLLTGEAERMRRSAGILRSEVARRIGCSQSTVGRRESGERVPRSDVCLVVAAAYGELASLAAPVGAGAR